jgi:hypothetical protein
MAADPKPGTKEFGDRSLARARKLRKEGGTTGAQRKLKPIKQGPAGALSPILDKAKNKPSLRQQLLKDRDDERRRARANAKSTTRKSKRKIVTKGLK